MNSEQLKKGKELESKIISIKAKIAFVEDKSEIKLVCLSKKKQNVTAISSLDFTSEDGVLLSNIQNLIKDNLEKRLDSLEKEFEEL